MPFALAFGRISHPVHHVHANRCPASVGKDQGAAQCVARMRSLHTQSGRKELLRHLVDGSAQAPRKVVPSSDMLRVGAWSL